MGMSFGHLMVLLVILLLVFGAGKLPQVMTDMAKGLKAFKKVMQEDNDKTNDTNTPVK